MSDNTIDSNTPFYVNNPISDSDTTVRTVEPNRPLDDTTEQRLFGAFRNTSDEINSNPPDAAQRTPMPDFITDRQVIPPQTPNYSRMPSRTSNYAAPMYPRRSSESDRRLQQNILNDPYGRDPRAFQYNQDLARTGQSTNSNGYPIDLSMNPMIGYDDARETDRDMEYLKQLYPRICKRLQLEIEEECDRLEYDGSCMFDEYPDRVCLERIIDRIYNRIRDLDEFRDAMPEEQPRRRQEDDDDDDNVPTFNNRRNDRSPYDYRGRRPNWVYDVIQIMFLNEMHNRRRRYRSRKRWF